MDDSLEQAKALLVKRCLELAHYYALQRLMTGLITTKRQIEQIQRVPIPTRSVELERLRERYAQMACNIERDELPALVDLIIKIIGSEQDEQ